MSNSQENKSKSVHPDDGTNERADHPPQIDSIPGGEKQTLPEEPKPPTVIKSSHEEKMGCTSTKTTDDEKDKKSDLKQQKITTYMPKNSSSSPPQIRKNSKKMKKDSDDDDGATQKYTPDFEDDQNNDDGATAKKTKGPVTRSKIAYSKLSINFEDSDNEDNKISSWAKRDIEDYRAGYPNHRQNSKQNTNLRFYRNEISSHPDGDLIDDIHKKWKGDYRKLEYHHGFIQWLFPLQEAGLNWSADPLQKHEIEAIKKDSKAMERIVKSYELMLDFYGFELKSQETGEVVRKKGKDWDDRFDNLNTSSHNYLRITRILKCLGEFDYEHFKYPFLRAVLIEAITENTIPKCLRSCRDYWIETLKDKDERRDIRNFARKLLEYRTRNERPPESFLAFHRPTLAKKAEKKSPIKHHRQSSDT